MKAALRTHWPDCAQNLHCSNTSLHLTASAQGTEFPSLFCRVSAWKSVLLCWSALSLESWLSWSTWTWSSLSCLFLIRSWIETPVNRSTSFSRSAVFIPGFCFENSLLHRKLCGEISLSSTFKRAHSQYTKHSPYIGYKSVAATYDNVTIVYTKKVICIYKVLILKVKTM